MLEMGSHLKSVARIVDSARASEVSRLSAQGLTNQQIADKLQIGTGTVDRDLKWVHGYYLQQSAEYRQRLVGEQLLKLEAYEQEAIDEWHRSKLAASEVSNETSTGAKGAGSKTRRRKKGRVGDSRLLKVALECIEQRRELMGLDLPEQTADDLERESSEPMVIEVTTRDAARIVMGSTDGRVAVRITDSPTVAPSAVEPLTVDACPVAPSSGQTVAPSHRQAPQDTDDLPTS
jgi:hypothetical protein